MSGIKNIDQNNKTIKNIQFRPDIVWANNLRPKTRKNRGPKGFQCRLHFLLIVSVLN